MSGSISELLVEVQDLVSNIEKICFGNKSEVVSHGGVMRGTLVKAIEDEIEARWAAIGSLVQGRQAVETKAALPGVGDGTVMYDVWNDSVDANNGLYGWASGAWIKSPFDTNRGVIDGIRRTGKYWLNAASTHDYNNLENGPLLVSAILAVRGFNVDLNTEYTINVMANNDATLQDRIVILAGTDSWDSGFSAITDKLNGPVWVTLTKSGGGSSFDILVDYAVLAGHDGVLLNTTHPYFSISTLSLLEGIEVGRSNSQDQTLISHDQRIAAASELAVSVQSNRVFNALSAIDFNDPDYVEVVSCFQSYYLQGLPKENQYRITVFQYSIPSEVSKIWVKDQDGVQLVWQGSLISSGIQSVELVGGGGVLGVTLNLDALTSNKIYVNTDASPFSFNGNESSTNQIESLNSAVAGNESDLLELENELFIPCVDRTRLNFSSAAHVAVAKSIVSARVLLGDTSGDYEIVVFANKDETFKNNIWIADGTTTVCKLVDSDFIPTEEGISRVVVPQVGGSGVEIELFIDYQQLKNQSGVLVNGGGVWLRMNKSSVSSFFVDYIDKRDAALSSEISYIGNESVFRNLRVSLLGSSTTWGLGYLGEGSYAGEVESYLRNKLATTFTPDQMITSGAWEIFGNEPMCYQSSIGKLSGVGSTVDFDLYGDEVSIALCKERGNSGAAIVELLIDGQVHDTFSTYNPLPEGSDVLNFVGDGSAKTFGLGRAFTYGHVVTFDSISQAGGINASGYGGSFVGSDVWMVVRKLVDLGGGQYEVHHFLTFKDAPSIGVVIRCNYNYGETIKPTLSTVGNVSALIGSGIESAYGEGSTAHDPANPVGLSSGLDFRQNDSRAVNTWRFTDTAVRKCQLRIKSLDSRSVGSTPELFIGFATNRMHYIQNAGVGGYKASDFLKVNTLTNLRQVSSFKPDFSIIKLAANDDWGVHEFKAWFPRVGVTDAELRLDDSAYYFKSIAGSGDNYLVDDSRCPITAVTPFTVTFDPAVVLGAVVKGDQVIFGDYKGDNRRLVVRLVDSWAGNVATFKQELLADDFIHISALADLVGTTAQVKSIAVWDQNIRSMIIGLRDTLPALRIGLSTDGLPNYNMRRLEGYPEAAKNIASSFFDVDFVDAYGATKRWTYDQNQNTSVYLDAAQSTASTGASSYALFKSNGSIWQDKAPRNVSVTVDGIERINEGCYVSGGEKKGWPVGTVTMTAENAETVIDQQMLVFTNDIPVPGAVITIRYSSDKWSSDDAHPNLIGDRLFGFVAVDALKRVV